MSKIQLKTTRQEKKPGTKTVWINVSEEIEDSDLQTAERIRSSASFFRRLGGSVSQSFGYSSFGYLLYKDVSTSPDKQNRTVREFIYK